MMINHLNLRNQKKSKKTKNRNLIKLCNLNSQLKINSVWFMISFDFVSMQSNNQSNF